MEDELAQIRRRRLEELARQVPAPGKAGPAPLTSDTLGAFLESHRLALVDVWAAWCGPCRMMEPIIDELAHQLTGRVAVGKVDADQNPDVVQKFGIQGIPTFLFFRDGSLAGKLVGARPKRDFLDVVAQLERGASADADQSLK